MVTFRSLQPREREHLRLLGAAVARPRANGARLDELRAAADRPEWSPLPRLRSLAMMEPLIRHHLLEAGFDERHLFEGPPPPPNDFERLALNHHSRRVRLQQTLRQFAEAGIREVLLLKGAALASRYPTPALRPMSDIDLCLRTEDIERARAALLAAGWQPGDRTWIHPHGHQLDTLAATSHLARRIWDRARRDEAAEADVGGIAVFVPDDVDHLYYLAGHGARHAGARLWLDLSDCDLLLDEGRRPEVAAEAFSRWGGASEPGAHGLGELSALLTLYNRWSYPERAVPDGAATLDGAARDRRDFLLESLPSLAFDPISAMQAAALRSLFRPRWRGVAFAVARLLHLRPAPPRSPIVVETDQLPDRFVPRQVAKLRLLAQLVREHRFRHYRRLAVTLDRIAKAERVFEAVDPLPHAPIGRAHGDR